MHALWRPGDYFFIMKAVSLPQHSAQWQQPKWLLRGIVTALVTLFSGTTFDAHQRRWIFQAVPPTDLTTTQESLGLVDQWVEFDSQETGAAVKLHGLWLAHPCADAPVLLFLHGANCDVRESAQRMQRLHELGFGVLAIDYRGFGQSTSALPSERTAFEDARCAWNWLAQRHPHARRYIYGHSLGGAIAVHLATEVDDAAGLIVDGTFTSIPAVVGTFKWGWLPLAPLITQRFDSAKRITKVKAPMLVVHGSEDQLIRPELGRALFECANGPKRFVLVEGGSHHDTHEIGHLQYREAVRDLFGLS
jgi:uncharacterized protein